jgi:PAS domain S-box-containing protein
MSTLAERLAALDGDLERALQELRVPAFLLDRAGAIVWLNRAGRELVGDAVGRSLEQLAAPADVGRAREVVRARPVGTAAADVELSLVTRDGSQRRVGVSSAAVRSDGRMVAVFGLASPRERGRREPPRASLTPRQEEVLRLLAAGRSTDEIAAELHLARETVRNHVRAVLRAVGAHTRLEAVVTAQRLGLLPRRT